MQSEAMCWSLSNEEQTVLAGFYVGESLKGNGVIHLVGEMGAGKTTFCRGVLRYYGHEGAVKSPTYTLVEPYSLSQCEIYHFDLFRLSDPEEFNYLGFDDYFSSRSICLVEWPEKGAEFLPLCDLIITIKSQCQRAEKNSNFDSGESGGESRQSRSVKPLVESRATECELVVPIEGRSLTITAHSDYGKTLMAKLAKKSL